MPHDCLLGCFYGDRLNHPMLITVVFSLFKLEDKKELHEQVKSQWIALRGFNWQHSKSYIMPKPTDLLRHSILFAKFNMLTRVFSGFLANIDGEYTPHDFLAEQGHSVSPDKVARGLFHGRWGTIIL